MPLFSTFVVCNLIGHDFQLLCHIYISAITKRTMFQSIHILMSLDFKLKYFTDLNSRATQKIYFYTPLNSP